MRVTNLLSLGLAAVLGAGLTLSTGCVEEGRYETNKPVIEDDAYENDAIEINQEPMENDAEQAWEETKQDASEAWEDTKQGAKDAVDAVTPDKPIVDIDTPLGDVEVGEDPLTGDKNVEVDADGNSEE